MSKQYENLVARLGKDGARQYMADLRTKVKNPGFKNMDKQKLREIAKLGAKARHKQDETLPPQTKEQDTQSQG